VQNIRGKKIEAHKGKEAPKKVIEEDYHLKEGVCFVKL
jgi:hypothetical protein